MAPRYETRLIKLFPRVSSSFELAEHDDWLEKIALTDKVECVQLFRMGNRN